MAAMVSWASGLLAMLGEQHPALKLHALHQLNSLVHLFWPEISTSVPTIGRLFLLYEEVSSYLSEAVEQAVDASGSTPRGTPSKVDRSGRFCSPRAARELALLIAYAACLEGSDPVRLFVRRVNAKRDHGYVFDKSSLLRYDHMSFGGAPVETGTEEEAEELMLKNEKDSTNGYEGRIVGGWDGRYTRGLC